MILVDYHQAFLCILLSCQLKLLNFAIQSRNCRLLCLSREPLCKRHQLLNLTNELLVDFQSLIELSSQYLILENNIFAMPYCNQLKEKLFQILLVFVLKHVI